MTAGSRFKIELATREDDAGIRALLRENPVSGSMSVTFEREPSFFDSCVVRGDFQVGLARDSAMGKVIGLGTRSVAPAFINGKETLLGYLSDLRLQPEYRGGTLVARAYRLLRDMHGDGCTRLYATVIFADNQQAIGTIATARAGLPVYHDIGRFHCPGINLGRPRPAVPTEIEITRGSPALLPQIIECLNRNGRRKQLAPVHSMTDFVSGRWKGFAPGDFLVALRHGTVVGVVGLWDQREFRQTRIAGYSGKLRTLLPIANIARRVAGRGSYPSVGDELRYLYLCFIAIDDDELHIFSVLLRLAYNEACIRRHCIYLMAGLHERDPLIAALRDYRLTAFNARGFIVSFPEDEPEFRKLDDRVPYLELATF
jgi:hypothetical protein